VPALIVPRTRRAGAILFIDHFQRATQSAFRTAHQEQRPNGVDCRTLAADDLAHVRGMNAQFINRQPVPFGGGDGDSIWPVHQPLNHVIEKSFHSRQYQFGPIRPVETQAVAVAAGAFFRAFLMKLATVSDG
jgi:hypothetical protein